MRELQMVLNQLKGALVEDIYMSERRLIIKTDKTIALFEVLGDCCSTSLFYDFIGIKDLLNKQIDSIEEVELKGEDIVEGEDGNWTVFQDKKMEDECVEVYGYQINYIDPEFGERTAVFSFRNYSNGYYGGWMEGEVIDKLPENLPPLITEDVLETQSE